MYANVITDSLTLLLKTGKNANPEFVRIEGDGKDASVQKIPFSITADGEMTALDFPKSMDFSSVMPIIRSAFGDSNPAPVKPSLTYVQFFEDVEDLGKYLDAKLSASNEQTSQDRLNIFADFVHDLNLLIFAVRQSERTEK